jgi:glycosyltransferase involved in cell wall biosynthesis
MAPLVSIGIPTFNRARRLDRAIASAVGQTAVDLEIRVYDDGSTDETPAVCARWADLDPRIVVVRNDANGGPTANFNKLFTESLGDYVLMLSDDDWLDADYVERCLAVFTGHPELVAVAGNAHYHGPGGFVHAGRITQLPDPDVRARLYRYFADPDDGPFYAVIRANAKRIAGSMPNVLGNDWLHVGRIAAAGPVAMIDDTHVNRDLGGTSATIAKVVRTFGGPRFEAWIPHLVIAWHVFAEICWRAPVYDVLGGRASRLATAARCAPGVIVWRSLAWHLTEPIASGLDRRAPTRFLARGYWRLTKRLGANHDH